MYAIFENGSKQYKASVGDVVKLEKLNAEVGATVVFPVVMTADDNGNVKTGAELSKVAVAAEVLSIGKDKKIIVFKYKAKKNERKKQGHRQPYTTVKVTAIGEGLSAKKAEAKPAAAKPAAKKAAPKAEEVKEVKAEVKTEAKPAAEKKPAAAKPAAAKSTTAKPAAEKKPAAAKSTAAKPAASKAPAEKKPAAAKKPAAKKD